MSALDIRGVALPTLNELDAEIARRAPMWKPQPGPQTMAFESEAYFVGYGGAAGGGKSDLALGVCVTQAHNAIIFRREITQVKGAQGLLARSREVIGDRGELNLNDLQWKNLPGGRSLEFAGVKHIDDWNKHRGKPHDTIVFDEATEFEEIQVRMLSGWNRTTIAGQRCRIILPFNPPGRTRGQWIISFFRPWLDPKHPRPANPGELRWFAVVDGDDVEVDGPEPFEHVRKDGRRETIRPTSRTFIPARLDDNAFLRDTNYAATLQSLPEPERSKLLYGDFNAEDDDHPYQVIPTAWVVLAQERWIDRDRPDIPMTAVGGDIARGGKDRTVFAPRWDTYYGELDAHAGEETPDGASVVTLLMLLFGPDDKPVVGLDAIGVGASPVDKAREKGIQVVALVASEKADERATDRSGKYHFANQRAQWWWKFRESLDPEKGDDVALPPDRELLVDLCAPRYETRLGKIYIEHKDDIVKRIGRSPDKGEAVIHASAVHRMNVGYRSIVKRQQLPGRGALPVSWKRKRELF